MVQRQNRVVAGRVAVLAFALMGLYSCAALSALGMGRTPDACPTLRDAQAWINKMPSINQRRDHAIMVSLMFEDEARAIGEFQGQAQRFAFEPSLWDGVTGQGPWDGLRPAQVQFALLSEMSREAGRAIMVEKTEETLTVLV